MASACCCGALGAGLLVGCGDPGAEFGDTGGGGVAGADDVGLFVLEALALALAVELDQQQAVARELAAVAARIPEEIVALHRERWEEFAEHAEDGADLPGLRGNAVGVGNGERTIPGWPLPDPADLRMV